VRLCVFTVYAPQFVQRASTVETAHTNVQIAASGLRQAERDVTVTQRASLDVNMDGSVTIVTQVYCYRYHCYSHFNSLSKLYGALNLRDQKITHHIAGLVNGGRVRRA